MNFGSLKKRILCDFSDLDIEEIEVLPARFLNDADFLILVKHKNRFDMTSHKCPLSEYLGQLRGFD